MVRSGAGRVPGLGGGRVTGIVAGIMGGVGSGIAAGVGTGVGKPVDSSLSVFFWANKPFANFIEVGVEGIKLRYFCFISPSVNAAKAFASSLYVLLGSEFARSILFLFYLYTNVWNLCESVLLPIGRVDFKIAGYCLAISNGCISVKTTTLRKRQKENSKLYIFIINIGINYWKFGINYKTNFNNEKFS